MCKMWKDLSAARRDWIVTESRTTSNTFTVSPSFSRWHTLKYNSTILTQLIHLGTEQTRPKIKKDPEMRQRVLWSVRWPHCNPTQLPVPSQPLLAPTKPLNPSLTSHHWRGDASSRPFVSYFCSWWIWHAPSDPRPQKQCFFRARRDLWLGSLHETQGLSVFNSWRSRFWYTPMNKSTCKINKT